MAKIKLTESVSISELKHMREVEGLSNAEIAKRVGCAVSTVIAYIGKQPVEMTKRNQMAGMRRVKQEEPSTPVGEPTKHHESFADLVARVKAEAVVEKNKKELGLSNAEPEPETRKTVAEVAKKATEYFEEKAAMMAKRKADAEADKAREAHCKEMESARAAGDKMAVFRKTGNPVDIPHDATLGEISEAYFGRHAFDTRAHINELLAVFGPDVVRQYLRVALYALGIPDSHQVRREHLLEALNTLNKEEICND